MPDQTTAASDPRKGYLYAVIIGTLLAACLLGLRDMMNIAIAITVYLLTGTIGGHCV